MKNRMTITFSALPENEALARTAVSAFLLPLNPTIEVLADVKTAVSEAVTNAIIHGYPCGTGDIVLQATIGEDDCLSLEVRDRGVGIANILQAMQPFYSSDPMSERSGMGFTVMQSFMDHIEVHSSPQNGTVVQMKKQISTPQEQPACMA